MVTLVPVVTEDPLMTTETPVKAVCADVELAPPFEMVVVIDDCTVIGQSTIGGTLVTGLPVIALPQYSARVPEFVVVPDPRSAIST